ncbi:MAG: antitoxin Xre/MbcA/ParS toxin-binding domain-containing protein [Xanthobacteraceae bacterium]
MARAAARKLKSIPKLAGFAEEAQPFLHDDIVRGVPAKRVQELIDKGVLPAKAVYRVIPERTFKRRLANREALKPSEADAVARLLRVTETAIKAFGDVDFARRYLSLPVPALGDKIPLELAQTDSGAREVEAALMRFAHGIYI